MSIRNEEVKLTNLSIDEIKVYQKNEKSKISYEHPISVGFLQKTTLAKLIVNNIKCDYVYLNASDENGIDMIREKVKGFASSATFNALLS